eukprot:TRINITY_DN13887_c1_g1_i2.p1 TRINITY_DN13887_c1_g1~~TRINITY_DN13887_c1_g1_i2.p1  ORF type:complete len:401 (+),score=76.45 TRINITY_DN13887_c1_g1_i2:86-1288(+)
MARQPTFPAAAGAVSPPPSDGDVSPPPSDDEQAPPPQWHQQQEGQPHPLQQQHQHLQQLQSQQHQHQYHHQLQYTHHLHHQHQPHQQHQHHQHHQQLNQQQHLLQHQHHQQQDGAAASAAQSMYQHFFREAREELLHALEASRQRRRAAELLAQEALPVPGPSQGQGQLLTHHQHFPAPTLHQQPQHPHHHGWHQMQHQGGWYHSEHSPQQGGAPQQHSVPASPRLLPHQAGPSSASLGGSKGLLHLKGGKGGHDGKGWYQGKGFKGSDEAAWDDGSAPWKGAKGRGKGVAGPDGGAAAGSWQDWSAPGGGAGSGGPAAQADGAARADAGGGTGDECPACCSGTPKVSLECARRGESCTGWRVCYRCAYRQDEEEGGFSIRKCPLCRAPIRRRVDEHTPR